MSQSLVIFRGKSIEPENLELKTRFAPITVFKYNLSQGRYIKILYLFGVIPIWRSIVGNLFSTEESDEFNQP